MNKRQKAAEEKRQQEIAAIECELRLIAMGAAGHARIEPDEGCDLFFIFGANEFSRWLSAVESHWEVRNREQESKFMMRPHSIDKWGTSYASAAEFLYESGARAGGEWL